MNGFWDATKEDEYFTYIWDIFSSVIDREEPDLAQMTKSECKEAVKREYQLDWLTMKEYNEVMWLDMICLK